MTKNLVAWLCSSFPIGMRTFFWMKHSRVCSGEVVWIKNKIESKFKVNSVTFTFYIDFNSMKCNSILFHSIQFIQNRLAPRGTTGISLEKIIKKQTSNTYVLLLILITLFRNQLYRQAFLVTMDSLHAFLESGSHGSYLLWTQPKSSWFTIYNNSNN